MARLIRHERSSEIEEACWRVLRSGSELVALADLLEVVLAGDVDAAGDSAGLAAMAKRLDLGLRQGLGDEHEFVVRWRRLGHLLRNLSYSSEAVAQAVKQLELGYHAEALTLRESGELEMLHAMADFLAVVGIDRPIYFDVGANRGEWMQAICGFDPAADLHVFEPQANLLPLLCEKARQISSMAPSVRIRLNPCGLSDQDRISSLYMTSQSDVLASTLASVQRGSFTGECTSVDVRLVRGDSYCLGAAIDSIACLKVDVEGAEMHVLAGFGEMIQSESISFIQFEYGKTTALAGSSLRELFDALCGSYRLLKILPEGYLPVDEADIAGHENYRWANYLAVHWRLEASFRAYLQGRASVESIGS